MLFTFGLNEVVGAFSYVTALEKWA